jgi:hypothetical protein
MAKMSLAWIEAQIEHEIDRGNIPDAVRDLAALLQVRQYMMEQGGETSTPHEHMGKHIAYDSALDTLPTLDQVERALGTIVVSTDAEKKRMQDAMTWAKILKGEE